MNINEEADQVREQAEAVEGVSVVSVGFVFCFPCIFGTRETCIGAKFSVKDCEFMVRT